MLSTWHVFELEMRKLIIWSTLTNSCLKSSTAPIIFLQSHILTFDLLLYTSSLYIYLPYHTFHFNLFLPLHSHLTKHNLNPTQNTQNPHKSCIKDKSHISVYQWVNKNSSRARFTSLLAFSSTSTNENMNIYHVRAWYNSICLDEVKSFAVSAAHPYN